MDLNNELTIHLKQGQSWITFKNPVDTIKVTSKENVLPALKTLDKYIQSSKYIAGMISYEAAAGIDSAYSAKEYNGFPLVHFGIYDTVIKSDHLSINPQNFRTEPWRVSQNRTYFKNNIKRIKDYIAAGDTYQVNYTLRLSASFQGDPISYFNFLVNNQEAPYAAYMESRDFAICSASPELFFSLKDSSLLSRPMKGTAARGLWYEDDINQSKYLQESAKEQAENLMITDMIRNDMGRICIPGSVKVSNLFHTSRFPTLWQMTSDVTGTTNSPFSQIIEALFPCASITGAPKARTMAIINELERTPRHIYTGSIGYFAPDRKAQFNVAIRTVLIDKQNMKAEYGVGSGIIWDSAAENEYKECILKSRVLKKRKVNFELLETMLWENNKIFLLDYHLKRLRQSAEYFNYKINIDAVSKALEQLYIKDKKLKYKIRLKLNRHGQFRAELVPIKNDIKEIVVGLAEKPVKINNPFLYHKTTHRSVYKKAQAQARKQSVDDIILWNENGEITETSIANVVLKYSGTFCTPPLRSGLLNGTFRQYLLDQRKVTEKVLYKNDLVNAEEIFLINSVRKWQKAKIIEKIIP